MDNFATIYEAMFAVQGQLDAAHKDGKGQFGSYVTFESTWHEIKAACQSAGLVVLQKPVAVEGQRVAVQTVLVHVASGEREDLGVMAMGAEGAGPQKLASALTYCRRYALETAFLLGRTDDDAAAAQAACEKAAAPLAVDDPRRRILNRVLAGLGKDGDTIEKYLAAKVTTGNADRAIAHLKKELAAATVGEESQMVDVAPGEEDQTAGLSDD